MVVCNVCGKNKEVEEMFSCFHYVCKDCWNKMTISIDDEQLDKEQLY